MTHDHGHDHHAHAHEGTGRAFAIGIVLNAAIVVVEVVYGILSHSMALFADAGHNLGDVLGLALAGGATVLARRAPTRRRTYGFRRITLLSALANGVVLLVATGAIAWESIRRLVEPEPVDAKTVIGVAAVAAVVNGASALLFLRGRKDDLNVRAAFVHLAGDAGIAAGVVVASFVVLRTAWLWVDPLASLAVAALILVSTWSLLRRAMGLVLDAVPEQIDIDAVYGYLASLPCVAEVHDLHVWAMSTTETALTAHLVMPPNSCAPSFLSDICHELHERFGIEHPTLQVDPQDAPRPCKLASDEAV
jgi:cobalt-zinc-cadmium efflux system protein